MRSLSNSESELVLNLHQGVFEAPLWRSFLNALRSMTGANSACFWFRRPDEGRANMVFADDGHLAMHEINMARRPVSRMIACVPVAFTTVASYRVCLT